MQNGFVKVTSLWTTRWEITEYQLIFFTKSTKKSLFQSISTKNHDHIRLIQHHILTITIFNHTKLRQILAIPVYSYSLIKSCSLVLIYSKVYERFTEFLAVLVDSLAGLICNNDLAGAITFFD